MACYEVDRFLNPAHELVDYTCGMCNKILNKPCQCKHCGTYYNYDCIKYKQCPNGCQKGKQDNSLYQVNKFMKKKMLTTLKVKCKYEKYGCKHSCSLKDIGAHEKKCEFQAFFCPNKG